LCLRRDETDKQLIAEVPTSILTHERLQQNLAGASRQAEALASAEARRIVDSLPSALSGTPDVILRTEDFITASHVWPVVPRDFYSGNAL
jgi:hypothetical protein